MLSDLWEHRMPQSTVPVLLEFAEQPRQAPGIWEHSQQTPVLFIFRAPWRTSCSTDTSSAFSDSARLGTS